MKEYEAVSDIRLTKRIPIIIRLDGNSFSKLTKEFGLIKPFDDKFTAAMWHAATETLSYCSGGQCAYVQSDEITLLLRNDMTPKTEAFLDNRIEKLCSLLAATCSVYFSSQLTRSLDTPIHGIFDCRVFLVPESEVKNAFLWRQNDAWKNCVSAVAWYGLLEKLGRKDAQRRLHKKGTNELQDVIFEELGINMNHYPTKFKRGVVIRRVERRLPIEELIGEERSLELGKAGEIVTRNKWEVDEDIPLFSQDANYIEQFLG